MHLLPIRKLHHFFSSYLLRALPAVLWYRFPAKSLKIYAITGTDGKTTSSSLLAHILRNAVRKVALVSTVAAFIGSEEIDTGFHVTSPQPWLVQKLLRRCASDGIDEVVLEVTAHGIFQFRVAGIPFALTGLTNITHEHLDYFESYNQYVRVKTQLLANSPLAFANKDDESWSLVNKLFTKMKGRRLVPYERRDLQGEIKKAVKARFPEPYNQWNAALVVKMAQEIGLSESEIIDGISTFPGVRGRMERIANSRGLQLIVDFAHTPNALKRALEALRPQTKGRLIAVYGSAGLRDRTKRPMMGGIGAKLADLCVFTAEDPRTEDINVIFRHMKEGVPSGLQKKVVTIADRKEAIRFALAQAKRGDTVAFFGKGHERSMCWGKTEHPWNEQEIVSQLAGERNVQPT